MLDFGEKWTAVPNWQTALVDQPDLTMVRCGALHLAMISGNLTAASRAVGTGVQSVGWGPVASGDLHVVRIARDRVLMVSLVPIELKPGWNEEGFAVSIVDDQFAVFEVDGGRSSELFSLATAVPFDGESRSAMMVFAGLHAAVYRTEQHRFRVLVESPHAAFFSHWASEMAKNPG